MNSRTNQNKQWQYRLQRPNSGQQPENSIWLQHKEASRTIAANIQTQGGSNAVPDPVHRTGQGDARPQGNSQGGAVRKENNQGGARPQGSNNQGGARPQNRQGGTGGGYSSSITTAGTVRTAVPETIATIGQTQAF